MTPKAWTITDYHHAATCPLLAGDKAVRVAGRDVHDPDFDCGCPRDVRDMTPAEIEWLEANVMPSLRQARGER